MAVDLQHLRYFAAVAEEGQVSRAAQRLYVTQPALSQAVRRLERDVGVELFARHSHGVALTAAGEDVLVEARAALAAADRVVAAAAAHKRGQGGALVVGALPDAVEMLGEPLATFRRARPDISVEVRLCSFSDQESALRDRVVDMALLWAPAADFNVFELSRQPLMLAMCTNHRLAHQPSVTIDDLDGEVFPGIHPDVPASWSDRYWLTEERGAPPRVTEVPATTSMQVILQVFNGRCVSPAPADLTDRHAHGLIVAKPILNIAPLTFGFAWTQTTAAVSAFVETLRCTHEAGPSARSSATHVGH
jgi:DNA-binding transcriptional LysR family regulator